MQLFRNHQNFSHVEEIKQKHIVFESSPQTLADNPGLLWSNCALYMFPTAQTMAHCAKQSHTSVGSSLSNYQRGLSSLWSPFIGAIAARTLTPDSWHVSTSTQNHTVVQERRGKSHQLYRDPYSQWSLMWQCDPHSSPDQSLLNLSPKSRRDMIEETNISPWDPFLRSGKRRKARDKGKGRGTRERERESENGRI